jgi:hypothetical protein
MFGVFDRWFGRIPCLRRRVVVNLVGDPNTAFSGVLWEHRGGWLVLKQAQYVVSGKTPIVVDGDVVIECAKVLFTQVVS